MCHCLFSTQLLVSRKDGCVYVWRANVANKNRYSDTVGNKGAFINITPDLKLDYVTFEAVVSFLMEGGEFF